MSRATDLAERLMGTCDDGGADLEALSVAELAELDDLVFRCEGCGWWCEAGEACENPDGGGDLCGDCSVEEDNG